MKLGTRRILIAIALVLLFLLGLSGWFYRSTREALERAESFSFRRMTVAQRPETETYRFFWLSNRRQQSAVEDLENAFTNERGEILHQGSFDTRIDASLGLGMIIDPTDWFQNQALEIEDVNALEREAFIEELRASVDASPHRALLVLVHGYRNGFPTSLRMTALVAHVLDINAPVLMVDWPGDQGSGLRGYRRAQEVARASGADLAASLDLIVEEIQPDRVWLVANSMGAQVVADAFTILYDDEDWKDAGRELEDVVLTAPDVGQNEFDEQFRDQIAAMTRQLTVYVSANDRALLASRLVNRERRLGESTLNPRNPDQFGEAASLAELIDPDDELITLIDVTPVNRTRNFHNFSLETPEFFDDLFLRLTAGIGCTKLGRCTGQAKI